MTLTSFYYAYKCLDSIYRKGAYSGIELNRYLNNAPKEDRALISKLVYGVLDRDIELEYVISLYAKSVKPALKPVLKIGIYALLHLNMPDYAVVSESVGLTRDIGKSATSGFVNAVLRGVARDKDAKSFKMPENEDEYLSVSCSFPLWAVRKLVGQLGREEAEAFMRSESQAPYTHVRINTGKISTEGFIKLLEKNGIEFGKSLLPDALLIKGPGFRKLDETLYTVQSLGSMLTVRAIKAEKTDEILDLCAAPGGKSVYAKQLYGCRKVVACDIHPHRVDLIGSYASRMGADIVTEVNDATVFRPEWNEAFDVVLCDAPCSGFGVFFDKPDVKLNKTENTVRELSALQLKILGTASAYVKKGGKLVYSTCTVFREENTDVVNAFLAEHKEFSVEKTPVPASLGNSPYNADGTVSFLPERDGVEGFFVAVLRKEKD